MSKNVICIYYVLKIAAPSVTTKNISLLEDKNMMTGIRGINVEATGRRIRNIRKHYKVKVSELASYFGFESVQAIYKWEKGKSLPTLENFLGLADFYTELSGEKFSVEAFTCRFGDEEDRSGSSGQDSLDGNAGPFSFIGDEIRSVKALIFGLKNTDKWIYVKRIYG